MKCQILFSGKTNEKYLKISVEIFNQSTKRGMLNPCPAE